MSYNLQNKNSSSYTDSSKHSSSYINITRNTVESFLLQETNFKILQENSGGILLETTGGQTSWNQINKS